MEAITDSAEVLERRELGDVRNRRKTKKDSCRCQSRWKYLLKKSFLYCSQVLVHKRKAKNNGSICVNKLV